VTGSEGYDMATFTITINKLVTATYVFTADTDDPAAVEKLENGKLRSDGYEESLNLDWEDVGFFPDIISVELIHPDEEE
jgi:hypothetical protein